jgi:hypothetical protein
VTAALRLRPARPGLARSATHTATRLCTWCGTGLKDAPMTEEQIDDLLEADGWLTTPEVRCPAHRELP